jgi:hypothetical protein
METLIIAATEDTPAVKFDVTSGVYELVGRSLPEDVTTFYKPVFDWLAGAAATGLSSIKFDVKLEYFNTASSKVILDIFSKLESIKEGGVDVSIHWHYAEDDEDMQEAGEEYSELVEVPFKLVAV